MPISRVFTNFCARITAEREGIQTRNIFVSHIMLPRHDYLLTQTPDESTFHPHYDGRFATKTLPDAERRINLTALVKSYLATMKDLGAETWLMHGTLIGWWWNRKVCLRWETDKAVI